METVPVLEPISLTAPEAAEAAISDVPVPQRQQQDEQPPVKGVNDDDQVHQVVSNITKAIDKAGSLAGPSAKYSVMIRDAIVMMKRRKGIDSLTIAKAIEPRYKSQLPANFHKMLQLQLRNLVRSGKLVKDGQLRYRCTAWFRKNPEAKRPASTTVATEPPATRARTRKTRRAPATATTRQPQRRRPQNKKPRKRVNTVNKKRSRSKTRSPGKEIGRPSGGPSNRSRKSRRRV